MGKKDTKKDGCKGLGLGTVQRKKFQNSEITIEVGGWVQVSLGILLLLEKHPKIALNQY